MSKLTLHPAQQESKRLLLSSLHRHGVALNSSSTGTGKTLVSVEIARDLGMPVFVVCPKIVRQSWSNTFSEQGVPQPTAVINYEKLRAGNTPYGKRLPRKDFLFTLPGGKHLVIFDEVHHCKGAASLNGRLLRAAKRAGHLVLMLSATAARNPGDMRWTGEVLGLHSGNDFVMWARKFGCNFDPWRRLVFLKSNMPKLEQLNAIMYPDKASKINRADMPELFTETSIITEPVDIGSADEIESLYSEIPQLAELEERMENDKASSLTDRLRARQAIEILKVDAMVTLTNEFLDEGRSVALFVNFSDTIDLLDDALGGGNPRITGSQSQSDRDNAIQSFQNGNARVILCNISAGGVGVSLHDTTGEHPRASVISPSDSLEHIVQALGRVDRAGSKSDSVQRIVFAARTVEQEVERNVRRKIIELHKLHDFQLDIPATPNQDEPPMTTNNKPEEQEATHQHAEFSPSGLKNYLRCPGFQSTGGSSPAAESGTRIHKALEIDDLDTLTDAEERFLAERCVQAREKLKGIHGVDDTWVQHREMRLTITAGPETTFGTADEVWVGKDEVVIVDWKTGKVLVDEPESNFQARAYALGSIQKHDKNVTFYFVHPRHNEISKGSFSVEDAPALAKDVASIIAKARGARCNPDLNDLTPGADLCVYCANVAKCPRVTGIAATVAAKYESLPSVPDLVHGSETNDPDEFVKLLALVPALEAWAQGVKRRATQFFLEDGVSLTGYKLATRAGGREITNAKAALDALSSVLGRTICPDEFLERMDGVKFNVVADLVEAQAPRGKKTALRNAFEDALLNAGALIQKPESHFVVKDRK